MANSIWNKGYLCVLAALLMGVTPLRVHHSSSQARSLLDPTHPAADLLFDRLYTWDAQLQPVPSLARSWKWMPRKGLLRIQLRKGVKWHDGRVFGAKDLAFTLRLQIARGVGIRWKYLGKMLHKIKVTGPFEALLSFREGMTAPLKYLDLPILPRHQLSTRAARRRFETRPIGTGPFRIVLRKRRSLRLQKNATYWRSKGVQLSGVKLSSRPRKPTQALLKGRLDCIVDLSPDDARSLARRKGLKLLARPNLRWWSMAVNVRKGRLLADLRLRRALLLGLDRDKLMGVHFGQGSILSGPFSPAHPHYDLELPTRAHDPKAAAQWLSKAGWRPGTQGLRWREKQPLLLRLVVPGAMRQKRPLLKAIQSQWKRLGVGLKIRWLSASQWKEKVLRQRDFDLALWQWSTGRDMKSLFHSKGTANWMGYRSPRVDHLLAQAKATSDIAIYRAIHKHLHRHLHKELPHLFLWAPNRYIAISNKIRRRLAHPTHLFHRIDLWERWP